MSRRFSGGQFAQPFGGLAEGHVPNSFIIAEGPGAPSSSSVGLATGCIYHRRDGSTNTAAYLNVGTSSSPSWAALIADGGTFSAITVTTLTTNSIVSNAAATWALPANTASAGGITDGTTSLIAIDTRKTVTVQNVVVNQPASQTLPDGATSRARLMTIAAPTVTLAGTTQVTTANNGMSLFIGGPTVNQSGGAVTMDQASTLHIGQVAAGASVTITTKYMVSTDVSDCFLTNAGVWTDHSCFADGKNSIGRNAKKAAQVIVDTLKAVRPATWKYKKSVHGDDFGRVRAGTIFDDLPENLRAPGEKKAVAGSLLASFAVAANRVLLDRIEALERRLAAQGG